MVTSRALQPLLRAALAHVPQHGFTRDAIRAAAAATRSEAERDAAHYDALFDTPGEATRQLMTAFDRRGLEVAHASLPPLIEARTTLTDPPHQRQQYDKQAAERAELLLAGKLLYSAPLRDQLVDALATITASASPISLPAATNWRAIPTPRPVVQRAWSVTDDALHWAQWKGHLQLDWYAHRARLSNAFLLAELHLLSPEVASSGADAHASVQLLRRLARPHKLLPPSEGAQEWVKWGVGGWLGIFRSLGL